MSSSIGEESYARVQRLIITSEIGNEGAQASYFLLEIVYFVQLCILREDLAYFSGCHLLGTCS